MIITSASIDGFKNLSGISFTPDRKYNIIVGANAQGKTNLLEALWITSGCKSFRGSKEKDYIRLDGNKLSLNIHVMDSVREQEIQFTMLRNADKNITLNGVKQKGTRALFDILKCIAFIPDDVDIVKGSPERRRSFIDLAASQLNPAFIANINRFNALLNQRNALLKSILQGREKPEMLDIWDRQTAQEGAVIAFMRHRYIGQINEICGRLYNTISGGNEILELEYRSNVYRETDFDTMTTVEAAEKYFSRLTESRDYDIRTGSTHAGVNRDDVFIKINDISAKDFASQGQIKSTALVMKLAQAEIFTKKSKDAPVIFLDDVMGELDECRQRFIFDIVRDMQIFLTTPNESAILPEIKGKIIRIKDGMIL